MPEPSITPTDNPTGDATSTTTPSEPTGTGDQTANNGDNLDASKSTDTPADGDKKPEDGGKDDTPASPELDSDLDDWASKRGFPKATTDAEKIAYQNQRNEQREFTRGRQAEKDAAELGTNIEKTKKEIDPEGELDEDEDDETEKRFKKLEADREAERTTRLQSEFYTSNKVTAEEHKAMLDIIKEKVARPTSKEGKAKALDLWSHPDSLPDLLDLARAKVVKATDSSAIREEAAQKERERIARESQAKSPSRSATNTSTSDASAEAQRTEALKARYSTK